jgi:ABC-type transporter Mla subunit MlaD
MERDELIRLLADRVLLLADRVEKNTEALLSVKRSLTELAGDLDDRERDWRHELVKVSSALAVLSKDVDDVEKATREATNKVALVPAEVDEKKKLPRALRYVGAAIGAGGAAYMAVREFFRGGE